MGPGGCKGKLSVDWCKRGPLGKKEVFLVNIQVRKILSTIIRYSDREKKAKTLGKAEMSHFLHRVHRTFLFRETAVLCPCMDNLIPTHMHILLGSGSPLQARAGGSNGSISSQEVTSKCSSLTT